MTQETNHIVSTEPKARVLDDQPVKPQKPMSIDEYIKALRKEAEVSKLRATIAKSMFEENMAMVQLHQLKAGQFTQQAPTQESNEDPQEEGTTDAD